MEKSEEFDIMNHPEKFPSFLKKCISDITDTPNQSAGVQEIKQNLENCCSKIIDDMWENECILQKSLFLKDLEEICPNIEAWRPSTGNIPSDNLFGQHLKLKKELLLQRIQETKEKSEDLKQILIEKRTKLKPQLDGVENHKYKAFFEDVSEQFCDGL